MRMVVFVRAANCSFWWTGRSEYCCIHGRLFIYYLSFVLSHVCYARMAHASVLYTGSGHQWITGDQFYTYMHLSIDIVNLIMISLTHPGMRSLVISGVPPGLL